MAERASSVRLALAATLLTAACTSGASDPAVSSARAPIQVVFLAGGIEETLGGEEAAALAWLQSQPDLQERLVLLPDLDAQRLPPEAVLWWHHAASTALPSAAMRPETVAAARAHVDAGGSLLLTLLATSWAVPLGLETVPPDEVAIVDGTRFARWQPDPEDRMLAGLRSYRGHPLLRRFWGGAFTATPSPGRGYAVAAWTGDRWPDGGAVIGVAQRYIGILPARKVAVEYRPTAERAGGTVLAIGEGLYFADAGNRNRQQLEFLVRDAIGYLAGDLPPAPAGATIASAGAPALPATATAETRQAPPATPPGTPPPAEAPRPTWAELPGVLGATTYWSARGNGTRTIETPPGEPVTHPDAGAVLAAVTAARSGLILEGPSEAGAPFDLAAPRSVVIGRQEGLIEDLWSLPVRLLRGLRLGVRLGDGTTVWLDDAADRRSFVARPEGDTFEAAFGDVRLTAHLALPRDTGGLVLTLSISAPEPLTVLAAFEADNGMMWPREEQHLDDLLLGWDAGANALLWRDPTDVFSAQAGFGVAVASATAGEAILVGEDVSAEPGATPAAAPPGREIVLAVPYDPATSAAISFAVAGGMQPSAVSQREWHRLIEDPAAVWSDAANATRTLLAETLDVTTPDPTFDEAFRWAKVGLAEFLATTPGMGTGLTAGYAASADPQTATWAAANDFLRRPGYGWYFGRDAVWSMLATDAFGATSASAEALRLLARYQASDGRILHEMSPSWSIHYDAADSTPLFLIGLDHYVRATADRELLRALWPAVRRAVRFLESTDADGDGFIDNTGVGHGWIEGGAFYGAHTTFYLASVWAAALESVARMSEWMADAELSGSVGPRVAAVREALNREFWDAEGRFYYYGKRADGTFMSERTILPAVPMILGLVDEARARPLVDLFGSGEIATDWGARMTERSNPRYDPVGYHDGSVWPLFTGWTSLAAYRYHRPLVGFGSMNSNLRLHRFGNLGRIPEVLHGDFFASQGIAAATRGAVGVTSHQAWSHALAVLPVVEGLLGVRPDAMRNRLRIHPHLPGAWTQMTMHRVRIGDSAFRIGMQREDEATRFLIERLAGAAAVSLELSLPVPRAVLVNLDRDATTGVSIVEGERIVDHPSEKEAIVVVTPTETNATVTFRHSPFPRVIEPTAQLQPGAPSSGLRLLESQLGGGILSVRLEGLVGRTYQLAVATPWPLRSARGAPGARIVSPGPGRAVVELSFPGTGASYQRAELALEFRR